MYCFSIGAQGAPKCKAIHTFKHRSFMQNSRFVSFRKVKFCMKLGTDTIPEEAVKAALKETKVYIRSWRQILSTLFF
jgi:hypothetical protein